MAYPTITPANSTSFADAGSATNRTVAAPSDAANNVVYIWVVLDGNGGSVASTGFTAVIDNAPIPTASPTARGTLLRLEEGASPPATYTVTSASERAAGICWAVENDTGVDGSPAVDDGAAASSANCPTATPSVAGGIAILLVGTDNTSLPHGTVSGYTVINSRQQSSGGAVSAQYKELPDTSATGDNAVSLSASEEWMGATVIILGTGLPGGGSVPAFVVGYNRRRNI